jgi:hypothetical protein
MGKTQHFPGSNGQPGKGGSIASAQLVVKFGSIGVVAARQAR